MIGSIAILILEMIYTNTADWFNPDETADLSTFILFKVMHVAAYGFVMFILFDYFRFNHMKVLKTTTMIVAVTEIAGIAITTMHHIYQVPLETMPAFNKSLLIANSFLWNVALFIWIIFLFLTGRKNYPPIFPLQKYGVGILVLFLLGGSLPLLFRMEDFPVFFKIINFCSALNYLFLIEFSMKVPHIKEEKNCPDKGNIHP